LFPTITDHELATRRMRKGPLARGSLTQEKRETFRTPSSVDIAPLESEQLFEPKAPS
jgi:hypothetical protein